LGVEFEEKDYLPDYDELEFILKNHQKRLAEDAAKARIKIDSILNQNQNQTMERKVFDFVVCKASRISPVDIENRFKGQEKEARLAMERLIDSGDLWVDGDLCIRPAIEGLKQALAKPFSVRDTVKWFAEQMELKLRKNDHKGGWENDDMENLSWRLHDELTELGLAIRKELYTDNYDDIIEEAADVANFAMMIADLANKAKTVK
jgi:NTP pyrophosphatase (non-canonical NTP hydrolase)